MKTVLLLATMNTKQREAALLKEYIEQAGCGCLILDCSLVENHTPYDALRREMLALCGVEESALSELPKSEVHPMIQEAAGRITEKLYREGRIHGGIGMGGVQGTTIAAAALQRLPIGVPKMLFSAVANGQMRFGPLVGCSDMLIMHSVVDVAGSNRLIRRLLRHAGTAIAAMTEDEASDICGTRGAVGITMGGVTTACVSQIQEQLEQRGYEVLIFHCNGIGAQAMEALVAAGKIDAVMDITPHDVMDWLAGGLMPAQEDRYAAIRARGIPLLIAPGCADLILFAGQKNVPAEMRNRKSVEHNELHTHVKANYREIHALGDYLKDRLGRGANPVAVMIPERGFSQKNIAGGPLYEPESDRGFEDSLRDGTPGNFSLFPVDAHINDSAFADACVSVLIGMLEKAERKE